MDVRCEKCQTEYELDEARLKPGGVTVKCTNCGHMFKIRKRSATNVGAPVPNAEPPRQRPVSSKPPQAEAPRKRPDSMLDGDDPTAVNTKAAPPGPLDTNDGDGPTVPDRQWLIRLENGDQKSCRELASLQQWIVAGVVTRESLISRTGKTWKRLGDVAELAQYFLIADEARATREAKPTNRPPMKTPAATMLGVGGKQVPDDEDEARSTGSFKARSSTPPPPPPARTPVAGAPTVKPPPPPARPVTEPPPPPAPQKKEPNAGAEKSWAAMPEPAAGGRSTAAWASESMPASSPAPAGPQGPFGGKVAAIADEPAFASKSFAGKVRTEPGDERVFSSGPVGRVDEDDEEMFPSRRGSRGGMLLVIVALLVIGAAGAVVYIFAFRKKEGAVAAKPPIDASVALATPDAAAAPPADATSVAPPAPTATAVALAVLGGDLGSRLRTEIPTTEDPAIKAHLMLRLAQDLEDEAGLVTDKAASDKARKEAKQLVLDAATLAQKTLKTTADDPTASLAMAEVLRLQGKPAKDIKRYLDAAIASKDWTRDVALATALVLVRDGKLDDAKTAFGAADTDAGDVRAKFHLAMTAFTQNKPADAKPLVEQVLATQPDHAGAKALQARLATLVAKSDPLPPEEHPDRADHKDAGVPTQSHDPAPPPAGGGEGYDALIKKANALAESANCTKAIELYQKAIELKPGSVEALTGQGFCHIDAKQFSSAFSKFRAALTISPRYEPALWGIAQAYQQQGRKQDAIDSYKAYLDVYPGSAKAQKQLERLGAGGTTPPDPGTGSGSAAVPTPPPPTPTPTPTPPPPDPGAGSGSG